MELPCGRQSVRNGGWFQGTLIFVCEMGGKSDSGLLADRYGTPFNLLKGEMLLWQSVGSLVQVRLVGMWFPTEIWMSGK